MAIQIQNLDLEEQEQLDQIRHFWQKWGNLITWTLIVVLLSFAAWVGWQYWQRQQAAQASMLYVELERAATAGDSSRIERSLTDMKDRYAGTWYAAEGALVAAKALAEKGQLGPAKEALAWAVDKSSDEGLRAIARLRLASLQMGDKAFDDATKTLAADFPPSFVALAADRRGDLLMLQGKRAEAAAEYGKAYQGLGADGGDYRRLVGIKLNALGVDPEAGSKPAGAAS